jgi:hypothetical protein
MTEGPLAQYSSSLLQWIIQLLTSAGFNMLLQAMKTVQRQLSGEWHEGMCEILEYDAELELKDRWGKVAVVKRREKVRFLQDNIIAYEDQAWGEGEIFTEYECSPGVVVDRYRDGWKWKMLISLREVKHRGEVTEFRLTRKIRRGFTQSNEWYQTEIPYRTHHIRFNIIFPRNRPCQQMLVVERNRNRTTELAPLAFSFLPDGRQVISWEMDKPSINELYTCKWRW